MYLLIGCGYIGERVADLLLENGETVNAVTHSSESADKLSAVKQFPVLNADVGDMDSLRALQAKLPAMPEAVLHCASSNRGGAAQYQHVFVQGCKNLVEMFPTSHLLFTSSSSVYPQTDGSSVDETSPAEPDSLTSALLREAEKIVLNHAGGGAVARLAGLYGPHRSFVLKQFLQGTAAIEGNHGQGRCLNQIHREDASRAIVHLASGRKSGIFNVVDRHPMTQRECFLHLQTLFDRPLPPETEPKTERKRPWTHKCVMGDKLADSGFTWLYPSYFDALKNDRDLLPSILAQVAS